MKRKTQKKTEFLELGNCLNENPQWPGRWHECYGRTAPLMVELGAGRCDFSLGYAALRPEWNVMALDVKPERLWAGGTRAVERGLGNIRFLRHDIGRLAEALGPQEVDRFWVTFPDPYPKKRHAKRRMTGAPFLETYKKLLKPTGDVCFKTDNPELFDFTLETLAEFPGAQILEQTRDLHASPLKNDETGLLTFYEQKWIEEENAKIHYVRFVLV